MLGHVSQSVSPALASIYCNSAGISLLTGAKREGQEGGGLVDEGGAACVCECVCVGWGRTPQLISPPAVFFVPFHLSHASATSFVLSGEAFLLYILFLGAGFGPDWFRVIFLV